MLQNSYGRQPPHGQNRGSEEDLGTIGRILKDVTDVTAPQWLFTGKQRMPQATGNRRR